MTARDDYPWFDFVLWKDGVEYTHAHYKVRPGEFVGHVPAVEHRNAERAVIEMVPSLMDEIDRLRRRVAMEDEWVTLGHGRSGGTRYREQRMRGT